MAGFEGEWLAGPADPALADGAVHVWRFALDLPEAEVAELRGRLSPDEVARAERFVFPQHRARFVAARGLLRTVLGRYLKVDPAALCFAYSEYGKPFLKGREALQFNLSHSGGLGLLALARGRRTGVDVEQVRREVEHERIAGRFFSSREVAALRALPEEQRAPAFFACWTRKEAYIKAIGEGLSCPLDGFDVSVAPGDPAALLCVRDRPAAASQWTMEALEPGPGYVGAVVVEGGIHALEKFEMA